MSDRFDQRSSFFLENKICSQTWNLLFYAAKLGCLVFRTFFTSARACPSGVQTELKLLSSNSKGSSPILVYSEFRKTRQGVSNEKTIGLHYRNCTIWYLWSFTHIWYFFSLLYELGMSGYLGPCCISVDRSFTQQHCWSILTIYCRNFWDVYFFGNKDKNLNIQCTNGKQEYSYLLLWACELVSDIKWRLVNLKQV